MAERGGSKAPNQRKRKEPPSRYEAEGIEEERSEETHQAKRSKLTSEPQTEEVEPSITAVMALLLAMREDITQVKSSVSTLARKVSKLSGDRFESSCRGEIRIQQGASYAKHFKANSLTSMLVDGMHRSEVNKKEADVFLTDLQLRQNDCLTYLLTVCVFFCALLRVSALTFLIYSPSFLLCSPNMPI